MWAGGGQLTPVQRKQPTDLMPATASGAQPERKGAHSEAPRDYAGNSMASLEVRPMRCTAFLTWLAVVSLAATACAGRSSTDGSGWGGDDAMAPGMDAQSGADGGTALDASKHDAGISNDAAGTADAAGSPPDASDSGMSGSPCPGGPTTLDASLVMFEWNPPDVANWPITTQLTEVDFVPQGLNLQFSKRDGPNR